MLSEEEIRHVARIARIALSDAEVEEFRRQFEEIFRLLKQVRQLPLVNEEAVVATENRSEFREDVVKGFTAEEILQNAPKKRERYIIVPKNL